MNIGVIGSSVCSNQTYETAVEIGSLIAEQGAVLVCGGRSGVMEGAAEGALKKDGTTVGILPGMDRQQANEFVKYPVATGIGQARNLIVVLNSDVVIAVEGKYGTLSEIALALKHGISVVSLNSWDLSKITLDNSINKFFFKVETAEEAVGKACQLGEKRKR
ncbi:TIGR00725 family protein [Halanaerobium hydrogeniformans]|uniref:TIGR00725 family protein n=1 Tax=Halanaerobium hydrogeniformans TaxID=656519 RepID=E4RLY2_HALHG|nr:TIGR00725 family protein [Halanaerobium hydrogeniformans]ADQ14065.1 hypothetical protein Halsa_0609 [Halanaerobium hydrogeniformans]